MRLRRERYTVLVCGGRDYDDLNFVFRTLWTLNGERKITHLIHGGARGADYLASQWAIAARVQSTAYVAEWDKHGSAAGPIRNSYMLKDGQPDLVVAFPGGRGTEDMIAKAIKAGVKTHIAAR